MVRYVCFALLIVLAGCQPKTDSDASRVDAADNRIEQTYEQVRAGSFQYSTVAESIADAIAELEKDKSKLKSVEKVDIQDALDALDTAGASLDPYSEAPNKAAFEQDFATSDEKRIKAIEAGNDALFNVREARNLVNAYNVNNKYQAEIELFGLIIDDLLEAVRSFGGEPEDEDSAITNVP